MYGIKALFIGIKFHSLGLYFNILWFLNINKPWVAGKQSQQEGFITKKYSAIVEYVFRIHTAKKIVHAEPGEGSIHEYCTEEFVKM